MSDWIDMIRLRVDCRLAQEEQLTENCKWNFYFICGPGSPGSTRKFAMPLNKKGCKIHVESCTQYSG